MASVKLNNSHSEVVGAAGEGSKTHGVRGWRQAGDRTSVIPAACGTTAGSAVGRDPSPRRRSLQGVVDANQLCPDGCGVNYGVVRAKHLGFRIFIIYVSRVMESQSEMWCAKVQMDCIKELIMVQSLRGTNTNLLKKA